MAKMKECNSKLNVDRELLAIGSVVEYMVVCNVLNKLIKGVWRNAKIVVEPQGITLLEFNKDKIEL